MNNEQFNSEPESAQDAQLRQLLQSQLSVASPSEAFRERVARSASASTAKVTVSQRPTPSSARAWRLAVGVVTIAALVVGGSVLWPRATTKLAVAGVDLVRVEAAMARVTSAHFERYRVEGDKSIKESDLWFEDGKWRIDAQERGYTGLYIKGTSWSYDAKSNTVAVDKNSKGLFHRNMIGFSFRNLVHDFANPGSKTTVTPEGTTTINGRLMKQALVENADNYENTKISLVVDAKTDLPQSADMHVRTRYGKEGRWKLVFSYNKALEPQLFKPEFGPSVRFVDAPSKRNRKRIPWRPGITIRPTKSGAKNGSNKPGDTHSTVRIRSLEVNPHGSVFLSYTKSSNSFSDPDWLVSISDSLGTKYMWGGQLGNFPYKESDETTPPLKGRWWIPFGTPHSTGPWRPRTFTVEFKRFPTNLKAGQSFRVDTLKGMKFSIPVQKPSSSVVPPLIQSLGNAPSEIEVLNKQKNSGSGFKLLSKTRA